MSMTAQEPRELSAEEQKERADKCKAIEDRILGAIHNVREDVWELAKGLYEFNAENGWTALGYESQTDWLAQPEVGLKKSQFAKMVRRYKEYVATRQLPVVRTDDMPKGQVVLSEIDPSKLDIVLPAVEKGTVTLQKALEDAGTLGARDLRIEYGAETEPPLPPSSSVIDGTASDVGGKDDGKLTKEQREQLKREQLLVESAGMVDSWLEYGGDRRKAGRHLHRMQELHPVFAALAVVTACVDNVPLEGQEEPPSKEDAVGAWGELVKALRLPLPSAE